MPVTLPNLLARIQKGPVPPMSLIGGDNDFLVDHNFVTVREAILSAQPSIAVEPFPETIDLATVIDSYRTFSLFGGPRLLLVPEMNAFVTRKELTSIYTKALDDWKSAKTERKRGTALAKFLHVLGLLGLDVDASEADIARFLGMDADPRVADMLMTARSTGKHASRGEGDAALLMEAATQGGAPGTTLLMKTGALPEDSATVAAIESCGAVLACDLSRAQVGKVLARIISHIEEERGVRFDPAAAAALQRRLGIERMLADKFSKDMPDIRGFENQVERLATFVGDGGTVTAKIVEQQVGEVAGGARFEFGSLIAERKPLEALAKLRDLVAQVKREEPATPLDVIYGRFIFPIAEEMRQLLAVRSFARQQGLDIRRVPYNTFKDRHAEPLTSYLQTHGLVKQRPHPFALFKRFESAGRYSDAELLDGMEKVADLEVARKSGGTDPETATELLVLGLIKK